LNTLSPIVFAEYVVRGMTGDGSGRIVDAAPTVDSTALAALPLMA
jgi:hypothetical protein